MGTGISIYIILILQLISSLLPTNTSFNYTDEKCKQAFVDQCNCSSTDQWKHPNLCCETNNKTSIFGGNFTPDIYRYFNCDSQILSPHLIVTSCPDDWTDQSTRQLCEDPLTIRATLPVTAKRFGVEVTFRNKHCAICHSELMYVDTPVYFNIRNCSIIYLLLMMDEKYLLSVEFPLFVDFCDKYIPESINNIADHCSCQHPQDNFTNSGVLVQVVYDRDIDIKPLFTPNCTSDSSTYGREEECELGFIKINGTCKQILATDRCLQTYTFISTFDRYVADFLYSLNIMKAVINHGLSKHNDLLRRSGLEYLWIKEHATRRYQGNYKEFGDVCTTFYTDIIFAQPNGHEISQLRDTLDSCACNFDFLDKRETLDNSICEIDTTREDISGFSRIYFLDKIPCSSGNSSNAESGIQLSKYLGCDSHVHTNSQIIIKCHADWKVDKIRQKCETQNRNFLEEIVPVVLQIDNTDLYMIFRNKFCAICHDLHRYRTLPIIVDAATCIIEPRFRKHLQDNLTIADSIVFLLQDVSCDLYAFPYGTDVFKSCLCDTTSPPQHIVEIFSDEPKSSELKIACPKFKDTGMPKWQNCGFGNMEIAGQCRRIFQLNMCVINYRFVFHVLSGASTDKALLNSISNTFNSFRFYMRRNKQVYMISEPVTVPGFTYNKIKCVEIYVDVLFHQPINDDQQASLDTIIQLPCLDVKNCTLSFLPLDHALLDRFCNTSLKLLPDDHLGNVSTYCHVNSLLTQIIFVYYALVLSDVMN